MPSFGVIEFTGPEDSIGTMAVGAKIYAIADGDFTNTNLNLISPTLNKELLVSSILIKHYNVGRLFETRDVSNYNKIKQMGRYYVRTLNKLVGKTTNSYINNKPPLFTGKIC